MRWAGHVARFIFLYFVMILIFLGSIRIVPFLSTYGVSFVHLLFGFNSFQLFMLLFFSYFCFISFLIIC
jgi:hypothetical protein